MLKRLFVVFLLTLTSARADGLGDALGLSPHWNWKELESKHFRVTFPVELAQDAQKMTGYLEEAHEILSPVLQWEPDFKVQILVIDNADLANGLTAAIGRFGIVLYLTPPDPWFSTAYYDNWMRLLAIHEYTHYLNLDTTLDFYKPLRFIFGDLLLPNGLWPSWMLEGLAVYMETEFTQGGRGRSPLYEMILRAAVEDEVLNRPSFMTLDRLQGRVPRFPFGESAYLFGYQLMNQVARDEDQSVDTLGEISFQSARRIPFFINGNLENVTGKSWYRYWDEWVKKTRERMNQQLSQIRTRPLTPLHTEVEGGGNGLGIAIAPDQHTLAYTLHNENHRTTLMLKDLQTGHEKEIFTKISGVGMSFTQDSRFLVFSSVEHEGAYSQFSQLLVYDREKDRTEILASGLRARDPDLSWNDEWITFTHTQDATTGLMIAPVLRSKDHSNARLTLGTPELIYQPERYSRVANPKYSPDGKRIVFSLKDNARAEEKLMQIEVATRQVTPLETRGFNRYPVFSPDGTLYFVSDRSGVENLYALDPTHSRSTATHRVVTNVTTGVALPAIAKTNTVAQSQKPKIYLQHFTWRGWNVASFTPTAGTSGMPSELPPLAPPPAPRITSEAQDHSQAINYPVRDYSIYPSILPRQWSPVLLWSADQIYAGGMISGFDATDRHRYVLLGAYDSETRRGEFNALYSNRSLGPTLTFTSSLQGVNRTYSGGKIYAFDERLRSNAMISYPMKWTRSTLTPALALQVERRTTHIVQNTYGAAGVGPKRWTDSTPYADAHLFFADDVSSTPLGISPEEGSYSQLSVRRDHLNASSASTKAVVSHSRYWSWNHFVLAPSLRGSLASRARHVSVAGKRSQVTDGFSTDLLDDLPLRGYPYLSAPVRGAGVGTIEGRFPLVPIFRGWGTNPAFLENLYGFGFYEAAYFPYHEGSLRTLPSVGGGMRLSSQLLVLVPVVFSFEYHAGLKHGFGDKREFLIGVNLGQIGF